MITMRTKRALSGIGGIRVWHILLLVFMLSFIAVAPPLAQAAIPRYINYQGKLTDANDDPVTADVSVTVRIYGAESGGTALWTEIQTVTVTRGIFSILLGNTTALTSLDFNSAYWYSVEVESDGEMTPRQRLTAVAYAINADKLDGYDASDFLAVSPSGALTLTGGANKNIELNPTGTGDIVITIDSTSGDFRITNGTTNFVLVDNATGDVSLTQNLTVTGNITLDGSITDTSGAVTIADALTQTGSTNQVTFAGNVDANNGLDVTGALTVSGAATLSSALDMNSNIDLDYSGTSAALDVTQASTGPAAQFSGGRVIVGASEASNANATATGELYVLGDLEVDGTIYGSINSSGSQTLGATTVSSLTVTGTSDLQGNVSDSGGDFTIGDNLAVTGTSDLQGNVSDSGGAFTIADNTDVTATALTSGGTDDYALNVTQTLNDTGAAGGSDVYRGIKLNLTETAKTGWDNVYLMDLQVGGISEFLIADSGNITAGGTLNMNSNKITNVTDPTSNQDAATKTYVDSRTWATAGGWTESGSSVYATDTADNVGIGTTSTGTYKLNVSGSANVTSLYIGGALIASTNLSDTTTVAMLGENETISGNWVNTTNPWADNEVANDLTISGGTIDNSVIGATTQAAGTFSALTLKNTSATPTFTFTDSLGSDTMTYTSTASYPFYFSDKVSVQDILIRGSSPAVLTFGSGSSSVNLIYDPATDEIRFSRGTFAQDFRNLVKNGSFESFSAMEEFHSYDTAYTTATAVETQFGGMWDKNLGFQGGWQNFAPDDWTYVSGDVFQHAPTFFQTGFTDINIDANTWKEDFTEGVSAVRMAANTSGTPSVTTPGKISQVIANLKPSAVYSIGVKMRVDTAGGTARVDVEGEEGGKVAGNTSTTLSADITAISTSLSASDVTSFPKFGAIRVTQGAKTEDIRYEGLDDTQGANKFLKCTRAASPQSFTSGATIIVTPFTALQTTTDIEYKKFEGQFATDPKASEITISLSAETGIAYFDSVQIVAGGSVPEYGPNTVVDTGDQTIYGSLRIGRSSDEKGGILSVDKFVRARGVELFTDDPGLTGAMGGGATTMGGSGVFPPGPGWNNNTGQPASTQLFVSGDYTGTTSRDYKVVIGAGGAKYTWSYMDDSTGWAYQTGGADITPLPTSEALLGGDSTAKSGIKIKFSAASGTADDTWYFHASNETSFQANMSFQKETLYTPGKTRIYVDPDRASTYYNKLVFEDGMTKVSLSDLASAVTSSTPSYIGPVNRWTSNVGWLDMSASGSYTSPAPFFGNCNYEIVIVSNGTGTATYPSSDTFKYRVNNNNTWSAWSAEQLISGNQQSVGNGIYIQFYDPDFNGYYLSGTPGDTWAFTAFAGATGSGKVTSLNSKTGAIILEAGNNVTINDAVQDKIIISATAIDGSATNEVNTSMAWNDETNTVSVVDAGGTQSAVITGFLESVNASLPLSGAGTAGSPLAVGVAGENTAGIIPSTGLTDAMVATGAGIAGPKISANFGAQAVQTGADTLDGQVKIFSEQGGTDYMATLNPNAAMTSNANFYLPLDEPAATYILNMTAGGVIGFDTNSYLIAESDSLATVTDRGPTTTNSITVGGFQTGANGADGQITVYSEQGGTDYTLTLAPNNAMTANATIKLPAAIAASESFMKMGTDGVIDYDTSAYSLSSHNHDGTYLTGVAWGDVTGALSSQTDLSNALALKAPLASPALTGDPTGPTATAGDSDTSIATTAFVGAAVQTGIAGLSWKEAVLDIIENNITTNPPTEVNGDRYLLSAAGGAPNANWDGASAGDMVQFNGALWVKRTPIDGDAVFVEDVDTGYVYTGTAWTPFTGATAYTWGNGLSPTGTTIDVGATAPITVDASNVGLSYDVTDFSLVNNALTITSSGVDHDATTNFVANEHIDWTNASSNLATAGTGAFTPAAITSAGSDDKLISLTQTLNDASPAENTQIYTGLKVNLTETSKVGWDAVNLMDLQVGDTSKFKVDDAGAVTAASIDLGAGANDDLTAVDVTDLTDGTATALHTHTDLAPGPHAPTHMTGAGGTDKVYWSQLDRANGEATTVSSEIDSDISTHAALTATHGISGAIVGTTDSQTLTNKTFSDGINLATVSGNVGIGTTSAGQKLHVTGAIKAATDATANADGYLYLGNDSHYLMWDDNYVGKDNLGNDVTGWMYTDTGVSVKNLEIRGASPATITFGSGSTSKQLQFDSATQEFSFTGGRLKQTFQNLIRNASFEGTQPTGWYSFNGGIYSLDTNQYKFGLKSLKIRDDNASAAEGAAFYFYDTTRLQGERLTLSLWAKTGSGTAVASIGFSDTYSDTTADNGEVSNILLDTTWRQFIVSYPGNTANKVLTSANQIVIYLFGSAGSASTSGNLGDVITGGNVATTTQTGGDGYVYIDGVTMIQGNLALDYGPSPILDTGPQVIYGNLAIGADASPYSGGMPQLIFGEPDSSFGTGYGTWNMGTGSIIFEQWSSDYGRFFFNRGIRIYPMASRGSSLHLMGYPRDTGTYGSSEPMFQIGYMPLSNSGSLGTYIGINSDGTAADYIHFQRYDTTKFKVDYNGNITATSISVGSTDLSGTASAAFTINKGSSGGQQDVSLQFSDDGMDNAHYLKWNDATDRFEMADTLAIIGNKNLVVAGTITAGSGTGNTITTAEGLLDAAKLSGTMPAGSLPSDGYSATYVNANGDTMTGALTLSPTSGNALVTTAGNVGIGTTSPGALLSLGSDAGTAAGGIQFGSDVSLYRSAANRLKTDDDLLVAQGLYTDAIKGYSGGALTFSSMSNVVFSNTGNVGIGTTGPTAKLQIEKDSAYNSETAGGIYIRSGGSGSKGLMLGADNTNSISYIQASSVGTTWVSPLALNPNGGNVGIGTTSPTALLSVGNSEAFKVTSLGAVTAGAINGQTIGASSSFETLTASGDLSVNQNSATADDVYFAVKHNSGDIFTVDKEGDVYIDGSLQVQGTQTILNVETVEVESNTLKMNRNITGSPLAAGASVVVERGTSADTALRWNETSDIWDLTADGTNYYGILNTNTSFSGDVSGAYNNLQLGADVVGANELASTAIQSGDIEAADLPSAIDAAKIANGTVSIAEFQYLGSVTSDIQEQLNTKQAAITGAAATIDTEDLTASRALVSNTSGKVAVSSVTSAELGYVSGVNSSIQNQINSKSAASDALTGLVQSTTAGASYITGGKVGIGITSPTADLTVKGNLSTALTGTVSVTAGTAAVTGSGTLFTTQLAVGDAIKIGSETFTVLARASDTSLTLNSVHTAGASGVPAYKDSDLFLVKDGNGVSMLTMDKSGNLAVEGTISATIEGTSSNANLLDNMDSTAFAILNGQSGGQTLDGGTGASENLTLQSTSHATKGFVLIPASKVGIGTTDPGAYKLNVNGTANFADNITLTAEKTVDGVDISNFATSGSLDHTKLSGIGANSHAAIDTHISATGTNVHGLGSISTQAANNVSITGGSITGVSAVSVSSGAVSVDAGQKLNVEGSAGDTYMKFNSTTNRLEFYVNGQVVAYFKN